MLAVAPKLAPSPLGPQRQHGKAVEARQEKRREVPPLLLLLVQQRAKARAPATRLQRTAVAAAPVASGAAPWLLVPPGVRGVAAWLPPPGVRGTAPGLPGVPPRQVLLLPSELPQMPAQESTSPQTPAQESVLEHGPGQVLVPVRVAHARVMWAAPGLP